MHRRLFAEAAWDEFDQKEFKNIHFSIIIFFGFGPFTTDAQSPGDPVADITFGPGTSTHAGPLAADSGYTSYTATEKLFHTTNF